MEALVEQLAACLRRLDELGHEIAAAHVNAAIESLIGNNVGEETQSDMDA